MSRIVAVDLFSYSPNILVADAVSLPLRNSAFDVVVLGWVLEFIPDFEIALQEAVRVLKPGGLLAVGAMYHPNSISLLEYNETREFGTRRWAPASAGEVVATIEAVSGRSARPLFISDVEPADADKRADIVAIVKLGRSHD